MTEEFETAGVCTETSWNSANSMFLAGFSLPRSTEIAIDTGSFEWQNIDTIDVKTYNESYHNTSTFLSDTNFDSNSRIYVSSQFNLHEEEKFNPVNSCLKGLFDYSEQLLVPNCAKPDLFESFHLFDDVFLNESRTVSVFDHEIREKAEEEIQAWQSLITCKGASEKTEELKDTELSPAPPLKRQRLETPSQFPSFKVRKEKLGDRITALQQLVSPFGKTDTASVLHDAIGYIKFLQEQISVSISNPHLNSKGSGEQKQVLKLVTG
ncbi:hypothetical protein EUTSA_v10025811mg [Eutrema salsugineum]|uniref:BHLH domain-containing protein n=1 Tax=Eutrema salsugineum TaxID=72664 RepID=V4MIQ3_EUTSA|nr:hypothetical protein EUTSA_v10025811mg [Eutrema salsugineum]